MSHNQGMMRRLPGMALLPLLLLAACGPSPAAKNPSTLWLSFSQREIDLVLVDQAPPIF